MREFQTKTTRKGLSAKGMRRYFRRALRTKAEHKTTAPKIAAISDGSKKGKRQKPLGLTAFKEKGGVESSGSERIDYNSQNPDFSSDNGAPINP